MMKEEKPQRGSEGRLPWQTPRLKLIGDLEEIVRGGVGKLSPAGSDPGDIRKPPGQG